VLGSVEAVSAKKEIEELGMRERAIKLNRLIFFLYQKHENARIWMFAEIKKYSNGKERKG